MVVSIRIVLGGRSDGCREGIVCRKVGLGGDGCDAGGAEVVVVLWSEFLDGSRIE